MLLGCLELTLLQLVDEIAVDAVVERDEEVEVVLVREEEM